MFLYRIFGEKSYPNGVFPRPFQMGGQNLYFWPHICFHSWGVSLKSQKNFFGAEGYWKFMSLIWKSWPLMVFQMRISFYLYLFKIFYVNFPQLWYIFMGGQTPWPPTFFRWGVRNFFHGGQIVFYHPDPPSDTPEGKPCYRNS